MLDLFLQNICKPQASPCHLLFSFTSEASSCCQVRPPASRRPWSFGTIESSGRRRRRRWVDSDPPKGGKRRSAAKSLSGLSTRDTYISHDKSILRCLDRLSINCCVFPQTVWSDKGLILMVAVKAGCLIGGAHRGVRLSRGCDKTTGSLQTSSATQAYIKACNHPQSAYISA